LFETSLRDERRIPFQTKPVLRWCYSCWLAIRC